jgi:hypothetical protein
VALTLVGIDVNAHELTVTRASQAQSGAPDRDEASVADGGAELAAAGRLTR